MVNAPALREAIRKRFGKDVYAVDELGKTWTLNRSHLAKQVFGNDQALADLNALVHPAVAADALQWHQKQTAPYTLHEAAITFETGGDRVLAAVIVVTAPEKIRLERVMRRDQTDAAAVKARMAKQWPEDKKVAQADYLIKNFAHHLLMPQVVNIHNQLINRYA